MWLPIPAASTAFITAVALSATASVPVARPRAAPVSSAPVSSTPVRAAPVSSAPVSSAPVSSPQAGTSAATITRVAPRVAFAWPLSPRPAVLRFFDQPLDQWSPGHRGVDLSAAVGQPVLSAGDGIVTFSGVIAGRGVVTVRHSAALRTTYEPMDQPLASGTLVSRGARVGVLSSAPGHCVPLQCLHWGVISGQAYLDPLSLLGFGRPILLPLG